MKEEERLIKEEAEAVLREGGAQSFRIEGGGDNWFVWAGLGDAMTVCAFSARNGETPNDPVYLARQALAHLHEPAHRAPQPEPAPEPKPESESLFGEPAEAAYSGEDETHGETGEPDAPASEDAGPADEGNAAGLDLGYSDPGRDGPKAEEAGVDAGDERGSDLSGAFDADFAPIEDEPPERDALDADLIPLRGIAWDENTVADEEAAASTEGPIAYAASDLDALVREKLGRVSQIARELKAALQDGWTIDEFRSLQNLIVRIDRGEATDDAQARARFVAISERSQAMSRVDAHRDALEAALDAIGKARDYQGARDFDPEAGWP